jgi:RNA polymerase sigma factor (sigma-70 family)
MNAAVISSPASSGQPFCHPQNSELTDDILLKSLYYHTEEWAIEVLYERYKRYVYAIAYHIVGSSSLAEDVMQEVFCIIWQKAFFYCEERGSFKSWLQIITRNRALDKVRPLHAHYTQYTPSQEMSQLVLYSNEPELWEQAWQTEQTNYVRKALLQLPPEQRLAIELSYFAGYSHTEIAKRLQLNLGTVKGRLRLGLRKMRRILQGYGIDMYS